MTYRENILQKTYWLIFFNVIIWIICSVDFGTSLVGKLPTVFKVTFTTFSICGLIMFLIHEAHLLREEDSTRKKLFNFFLYYIVIGFGSIFIILWLEMGYFGFYPIFIWTVVFYAWIAFLVIAALDLKPMKEEFGAKGFVNMAIFYLVMCIGYTAMGYALPQYDPQYEIKKIIGDRGDLSSANQETLKKVGGEIFKDFECFNCHNAAPGGIVKRGPNLATTDLGGKENILENIVAPYKVISKGFDKPKIRNAMPDYYGQQIKPLELKALIEYMGSLNAEASISTEKMPDGWWTDPKILEEGGNIYEGLVNEDVVCSACHGSEGPPLMDGARDFREKEYMNSRTDKDLYDAVANGIMDLEGEPTPMDEWGSMLSPSQIWKTIAYTFKQFTDGRKGVDYGADVVKKEKEIWRPWPWR